MEQGRNCPAFGCLAENSGEYVGSFAQTRVKDIGDVGAREYA
jgi:hypothetical protein